MQNITPLQIVAITNFILSSECFLLFGILFGRIKSLRSESGLLSIVLFFVALAVFMGGLDHGFFEPINKRDIVTTLTYVFTAFATFFLFYFCIITYFKNKFSLFLKVIAFAQLIIFLISSFFYHNFILVVMNYSPVLLLFFIVNLINVSKSKSNKYLVLFCITIILATIFQISKFELTTMLNGDSLFHIISNIAYFFFFLGALTHINSEKEAKNQ